MTPRLEIRDVAKSFTMHLRGIHMPVVEHVTFEVFPGECVALGGPSGTGKSSILKMVYGNYAIDAGAIRIADADGPVDLASADPRRVLALRRRTVGYVSQFLRVVPRVATLAVVAEPLLALGVPEAEARGRAAAMLARLNIPERLWPLSPTTFSGGEQQRVNIARGFVHAWPAMLLDEPTASLDAGNRAVVLALIAEAKARGAAILGIFHDEAARAQVCDRVVDVTGFSVPS